MIMMTYILSFAWVNRVAAESAMSHVGSIVEFTYSM